MVEQIKALCAMNNTNIKSLEKELGFGNGTIRRWDERKPSYDRIEKVAKRFNISVSDLTGEQKKPTPKDGDGLAYSDEDVRHLEAFHRADENTKAAIRLLLAQYEKESGE